MSQSIVAVKDEDSEEAAEVMSLGVWRTQTGDSEVVGETRVKFLLVKAP